MAWLLLSVQSFSKDDRGFMIEFHRHDDDMLHMQTKVQHSMLVLRDDHGCF